MKNFPVTYKGKEYWISRAIAVVVKILAKDIRGNEYILAVKRGKGTPDPEFIGSWCMPCGYLDFDETTKQAAQREVFEETGLNFPISDFNLVNINDIPESDKRQNITFRFIIKSMIPVEDLSKKFTTLNSEKDEISEIKFIPIVELDKYKWAFNHNKIITEI